MEDARERRTDIKMTDTKAVILALALALVTTQVDPQVRITMNEKTSCDNFVLTASVWLHSNPAVCSHVCVFHDS